MMEETIATTSVQYLRAKYRCRCWLHYVGKGSRLMLLMRLGVDPFVAPEQTRHVPQLSPARACEVTYASNCTPRDRHAHPDCLQTKSEMVRKPLRCCSDANTVEPVSSCQIKLGDAA